MENITTWEEAAELANEIVEILSDKEIKSLGAGAKVEWLQCVESFEEFDDLDRQSIGRIAYEVGRKCRPKRRLRAK